MPDISAAFAALIGVFSAVFSGGVTYGIMRTKLDRIESDLAIETSRRENFEDRFVTHNYFQAVLAPVQHTLQELGKDIKRVLLILSRNHSGDECEK